MATWVFAMGHLNSLGCRVDDDELCAVILIIKLRSQLCVLYAHGPTLQRLGGLLARLRYRQNLLVPTFFLDEYSGILFQSIFCMNIFGNFVPTFFWMNIREFGSNVWKQILEFASKNSIN